MKTEIINVTPQMASNWLSLNENNRNLRRTVVEGLKAAFSRGEYTMTHQGIAFSTTGELLDGQHRLTAISELRDGLFPMLVSTGVRADSFSAMDIGLKRTPADSLRIADRRLVEVARLIGVICLTKQASVTPLMLLPIIDAIQNNHEIIHSFCPGVSKTWSSAPVRLAAIASIASGGDCDYIKTTYRSLVHSDFDSMPRIAMSLYRANVSGHVRAADRYDMLARCMVVFDKKKSSNTKTQIKDTTEVMANIRSLYAHLIEKEELSDKKKAAPKGAAKSVLPRNFTLDAGAMRAYNFLTREALAKQ